MQVLNWQTQLDFPILAIMQLLPLAGMLVVRFVGNRAAALTALGTAVIEAMLALYLYLKFDRGSSALQFGEHLGLYGPLDYHAAVDGISVMFLLLTSVDLVHPADPARLPAVALGNVTEQGYDVHAIPSVHGQRSAAALARNPVARMAVRRSA